MSAVPENVLFSAIEGEVVYYICQGDDGLVEVIFDGELNPAEEVGPAKEGTPGALLVIGDKVRSIPSSFYKTGVKTF